MTNISILKKLEKIESNANRLLDKVAELKEELSGGSDSSFSQTSQGVLSEKEKQKLTARRHRTAFKPRP